MAVSRLTEQLDLRQADNVVMIYGQVNDIFITPDLLLHEHDGIDKILLYYLRQHGFERILYYATDRGLYVYDKNSGLLCFPQDTAAVSALPPTAIEGQFQSGQNGRPLGNTRLLKSDNTPVTPPVTARSNTLRRDEEGFYSVYTTEVAIADCLKTCFRDQQHKTAVIFSQFDQNSLKPAIEKLMDNIITRWIRNTSRNKCFFVFNASDLEQLKETTDDSPSLRNLLANAHKGQTLHALVCLQCPLEDEIRSLLNRIRLIENRNLDWLHLDKIVRAITSEQKQLKFWFNRLMQLERFNVENINSVLLPEWQINENEQSAWERLDRLIGLSELKRQLRSQVRYLKNEIANGNRNLPPVHIVLTGNPGTGKTTAARLIGEIFREEGLLRRGHLVETDRVQLVAGHVGQTALKTDEVCRSALGGVLFIDEAYSLSRKEQDNDFGKEAVDTLIKRMYDWNMQFVLILAGYPKPMAELLKSNPGFQRRIGRTIQIEDYTAEELTQIFSFMAASGRKNLAPDLLPAIQRIFAQAYRRRDDNFQNAGLPENLLREVGELHLQRCLRLDLNDLEEPIRPEDLPERFTEILRGGGDERDLDDALTELNGLTGLEKVKAHIKDMVLELRYNQMMNTTDGANDDAQMLQKINRHMVFLGNPGTGKTTVARLMGRIFKALKILLDGSVVEVSRVDFVAGYTGQTAIKTKEVLERALDKILFIDEAYDLRHGQYDTFGQEAINAILKFAEDHRDRLVIILAGYPQNMTSFFNSNPGLESRFPTRLDFEDYNDEHLFEILQRAIATSKHRLDPSATTKARKAVANIRAEKAGRSMGNARDIENFYKNTVLNIHRKRIVESVSRGELQFDDSRCWDITDDDFPGTTLKEQETLKKRFSLEEEKKKAETKGSYFTHTGTGDQFTGDKIYNININSKSNELAPKFIGAISKESTKHLVPRADLLPELHREVFDNTKEPRLLVTGIPGIGKSSLVRQFATTYEGSFRHIIWVDCSTTIAESFAGMENLAGYLDLNFQKKESSQARFEQILEKLPQLVKGQTCLLVIDNVGEAQHVEMQKLLPIDGFKIIFISRQRVGDFRHIEAKAMSTSESLALLKEQGLEAADPHFEELAQKVGNHPFALEVIAKKIRIRYFNDAGEALKVLSPHLPAHKTPSQKEIETIFLELIQPDSLSDVERHWMLQISVLPPLIYSFEEILEIFDITFNSEPKREISKILHQLLAKGFLSGDVNRLHCHPIIGDVIRHALPPTADNCQLLLFSLGRGLFSRLNKTAVRPELVQLAGRYLAYLEEITQYFEERVLMENMIFKNISVLASILGSFDRATTFIEKDYAVLRDRKTEEPLLFCSTARLTAGAAMLSGDSPKAQNLLEEAIELLDGKPMSQSPDAQLELLRLHRDLGSLLLYSGKINEAVGHFDRAHDLSLDLVHEDPYELGLLNLELAEALIHLESLEGAKELLKNAEDCFQKAKLPEENPVYGSYYLNRALLAAGNNDFSDAQFSIDQGIKIYNNALGEEHLLLSKVYQVKSAIALQYLTYEIYFGTEKKDDERQFARKIKQAREDADKSIQILKKYRPSVHPEFAMLYSNLGILCKYDGDFSACLEHHQAALQLLQGNIEERSFHRAIINFRAAVVFIEDDFLPDSEKERYLLDSEYALPEGEFFTFLRGVTSLLLGVVYKALEREREAVDRFLQAHRHFKVQFTDEHPLHALCLQEASTSYRKLGEKQPALDNQILATQMCEANMLPNEPELAESFMLLSERYREIDNRPDALRYRVKAERINPSIQKELEGGAGDCGRLFMYEDLTKPIWQFVILSNEELAQIAEDREALFEKVPILGVFNTEKKAYDRREELIKDYGACKTLSIGGGQQMVELVNLSLR